MPPRHTPASLSLPLSLRLCPFTNPFSPSFPLPRCTPPSSCPCPQNRPPGDRYYCYRYRSKASWKRGCLRFPFTLPLRPITSDHDTDGFTSPAGEEGGGGGGGGIGIGIEKTQYAWNRFVRPWFFVSARFLRSRPPAIPPFFQFSSLLFLPFFLSLSFPRFVFDRARAWIYTRGRGCFIEYRNRDDCLPFFPLDRNYGREILWNGNGN